ncbi:hypothetical protein ADUPG1_006593, partial [Aduncisulcus paluster]
EIGDVALDSHVERAVERILQKYGLIHGKLGDIQFSTSSSHVSLAESEAIKREKEEKEKKERERKRKEEEEERERKKREDEEKKKEGEKKRKEDEERRERERKRKEEEERERRRRRREEEEEERSRKERDMRRKQEEEEEERKRKRRKEEEEEERRKKEEDAEIKKENDWIVQQLRDTILALTKENEFHKQEALVLKDRIELISHQHTENIQMIKESFEAEKESLLGEIDGLKISLDDSIKDREKEKKEMVEALTMSETNLTEVKKSDSYVRGQFQKLKDLYEQLVHRSKIQDEEMVQIKKERAEYEQILGERQEQLRRKVKEIDDLRDRNIQLMKTHGVEQEMKKKMASQEQDLSLLRKTHRSVVDDGMKKGKELISVRSQLEKEKKGLTKLKRN